MIHATIARTRTARPMWLRSMSGSVTSLRKTTLSSRPRSSRERTEKAAKTCAHATYVGPYGHGATSAPHSTWSSSASTAATRSARDVKKRPAPGANDGTFACVMVER